MKVTTLVICLTLVLAGNTHAQQTSYTLKEFKPLHALAGLWKMDSPRGIYFEEWQVKQVDEMTSRSYKLKATDTVLLESVVLSLKDNAIYYTPIVQDQNNQQPIAFKLISCSHNKYIFENKAHDFPQRIIYELVSAMELRARIEGAKNGKEMSSDFLYKRVK